MVGGMEHNKKIPVCDAGYIAYHPCGVYAYRYNLSGLDSFPGAEAVQEFRVGWAKRSVPNTGRPQVIDCWARCALPNLQDRDFSASL
jgi:hypothetical protein